jgi:hypothetical protein
MIPRKLWLVVALLVATTVSAAPGLADSTAATSTGQMTWKSSKEGLSLGVPSNVVRFHVGHSMEIIVALRNDSKRPFSCSQADDVYYLDLSDAAGRVYTSPFPRDQPSNAAPPNLVTIDPGGVSEHMLNFLNYGLDQIEPGDYTVNVSRACAYEGVNPLPPFTSGKFEIIVVHP